MLSRELSAYKSQTVAEEARLTATVNSCDGHTFEVQIRSQNISPYSITRNWIDVEKLHRELLAGGFSQLPPLPHAQESAGAFMDALNIYFSHLISNLHVNLASQTGPQTVRQFLEQSNTVESALSSLSLLEPAAPPGAIPISNANQYSMNNPSHLSQSLPANHHFNLAPVAPCIRPATLKSELPPIFELPPSPSPGSLLDNRNGISMFGQRPSVGGRMPAAYSSSIPANFIFHSPAAASLPILGSLGANDPPKFAQYMQAQDTMTQQ